jgi:hypothetical protein
MTPDSCRDCTAFRVNPRADDEGTCHDKPPGVFVFLVDVPDSIDKETATFTVWPVVIADVDWCRKFERKEG